ncbi:MAG: DUF6345 domain-containing protein [Phycisphaerae bacterium]|jgi:hypothetical protein
MPSVGVEWVNNYDWLPQLSHEHEDAGGFFDELVQHAGWIGAFNWGDGNAWEDDFKRTDKGGHAPDWADAVDICYFTGHGSPWGFYFRSDVPDDDTAESDHVSGALNGDLRLGKNNLEWLALEVCNTLQWEAARGGSTYNVFDRWRAAFEGLHIMCSFTTTSLDRTTPGRYFAAFLDGRWPTVIFGLPFGFMVPQLSSKVIDAWFEMTSMVQPDWAEAAVLYAGKSGAYPGGDYIHGCGSVSADPYPHTYRVWIPHGC